MKIVETARFRKSFIALEKETRKKVYKKFELFIKNTIHPSLHVEKLEPKTRNIWSFRIDKNIRVIFAWTDSRTILILDIGLHDIYKTI